MSELNLRIIRKEDLPDCLDLCRLNHWNQIDEDWQLLLKLSGDDGRVALSDKKIVGSFTTINYGGLFSWVGMVLVHPDFQRQGIGKMLMSEAIRVQTGRGTIRLDATPAGRSLYLKLGFKDEYPMTRLYAENIKIDYLRSDAKKMELPDVKMISEYDQSIFGANRVSLLSSYQRRMSLGAYYVEDKNGIRGYCVGREGYKYNQIGPVVAEKFEDAVKVTSAAILNSPYKPVVMDVMLHDQRWMEWLNRIGFKEQRGFVRMYLGKNKNPGLPEKQFAIAGPEFG